MTDRGALRLALALDAALWVAAAGAAVVLWEELRPGCDRGRVAAAALASGLGGLAAGVAVLGLLPLNDDR